MTTANAMWGLERLEPRALFSATFTVTTTTDAGPGSLRQALLDANAAADSSVNVRFAIPGDGILVLAAVTQIGGPGAGDGNVIAGNNGDGIRIDGVHLDTLAPMFVVQRNAIGIGATGAPLANLGDGVRIATRATGITIGGDRAGMENRIAYNRDAGLAVGRASPQSDVAKGTSILGNSIFANAKPDIDLGDDGPTPNDELDADTGPNFLSNAPVLTAATRRAGITTVRLTLDARPRTPYRLQVFADTRDPAGRITARTLVYQATLTTNAAGHAWLKFLASSLRTGQTLTATATDVDLGATSEFSAPRTVLLAPRTPPATTLPPAAVQARSIFRQAPDDDDNGPDLLD